MKSMHLGYESAFRAQCMLKDAQAYPYKENHSLSIFLAGSTAVGALAHLHLFSENWQRYQDHAHLHNKTHESEIVYMNVHLKYSRKHTMKLTRSRFSFKQVNFLQFAVGVFVVGSSNLLELYGSGLTTWAIAVNYRVMMHSIWLQIFEKNKLA